MKTTISRNLIFTFLFALTLVYSCTKEDEEITGTLYVSFNINTTGASAWINPAENPDVIILRHLAPNEQGNFSQELNFGNYILNCYTSEYDFPEVGFQIMPGKTTKIQYTKGGGQIVQ